MRTIFLASLLLIALVGCMRGPAAAPPTVAQTKSDEGVVVFRGSDGRTLTQADLKQARGAFNYEVIGSGIIPEDANKLRKQWRAAGGKGDYTQAIELLKSAAEAAPEWPYPLYDLAYTYLLKKDYDNARLYYRKTLELSPRGFFTAITALDTLEREQQGEFPAGLYATYLSLEAMPPDHDAIVQKLTAEQPTFAPGWKELALLAEEPEQRLALLEKGLAAKPDRETKGLLLINKALMQHALGQTEDATKLLGELALDPASTFATEHLAKQVLRGILNE